MYWVCDVCGLLWDNSRDGTIRYSKGKHYCKKCLPDRTGTCGVCKATLRPQGERLSKWPGTKAMATKSRCHGCYRAHQKKSAPIRDDETFAMDVSCDAYRYLLRTGNTDVAGVIFGETFLGRVRAELGESGGTEG